jgi:hypothetical protein
MGSISDITDCWAKIFEIFFFNQEEEQKYVPPPKRSTLAIQPTDLSNKVQTTPPEAIPQLQSSTDDMPADQQQQRRSLNPHKLSFPEYNGNMEPSQWLYKCKKFFAAQNINGEERMQLAAFHL